MQFDQLRWRQFITLRSIGRAFLFRIFLTVHRSGLWGSKAKPRRRFAAIMQELRVEYLRLTNALLIDNLKDLEELAKAIQRHPLPGRIAAAIKRKLGASFRAFERINEQSHRAAGRPATRAMAKDVSEAPKAFGRLAEGCVKLPQTVPRNTPKFV
jgi:hypothetical protein